MESADMVFLVNGLLPYDSGKTWFTISLAKMLKDEGYNVSIYKPVAGHSAWYQFRTVINSLKYGILVGEDVVKYRKFLGLKRSFEQINPLDFLLTPLDPKVSSNFKAYVSELENQFVQIVLSRISDLKTGVTKHFIVAESKDKIISELKPWIGKLTEKLEAKPVRLEKLLKIAQSKETVEILNYGLDLLLKESDVVIIESFNDAAIPYFGFRKEIDAVFTVAPGYVWVVNVESFNNIVEENYLKYKDVGLKMSNILDKAKIVTKIPIPPAATISELSSRIRSRLKETLFKYILKHLS